jgi:hypothetical protein
MAIVCIPKMFPVPKGASQEKRERMFSEYVARLNAANSHLQGGMGSYLKRVSFGGK